MSKENNPYEEIILSWRWRVLIGVSIGVLGPK